MYCIYCIDVYSMYHVGAVRYRETKKYTKYIHTHMRACIHTYIYSYIHTMNSIQNNALLLDIVSPSRYPQDDFLFRAIQ